MATKLCPCSEKAAVGKQMIHGFVPIKFSLPKKDRETYLAYGHILLNPVYIPLRVLLSKYLIVHLFHIHQLK